MSLYNQLFGMNPLSGLFMAVVGLKPEDVPRFRDAYLSDDGKRVMIYTRTGGGNRECYCDNPHDEGCYAVANEGMTKNLNFVTDYDDDFDSTYATWEFKIPEAMLPHVQGIVANDNRPVGEKFKTLCEGLESGADTPESRQALVVGQKILDAIAQGEKQMKV